MKVMYEELVKLLRKEADCDEYENYVADMIGQAADAIEKLSEEVRDNKEIWDLYGGEDGITAAFEALERQQWISVEERKPPQEVEQETGKWSKKVWFWCKPGFEAVGYYNYTHDYWMTADEVSDYDSDEATHWMPLPSTEGLNET